jgi:DNA-binding transcriptional LysR family regulator
MNLNIEALRGLVKIAELGTVTKAAEALRIAQPALSRKLKQLEKQFNQPLFIRSGRYLELTPLGHVVVSRAKNVLQNLDALQNIGREYKGRPVIKIGVSLTTLAGFLRPAVSHFRHTHPDVDIVIQTGLSQDIYDLLAKGKIDIGMVSSPQVHPFIVTQTLFVDRLWLICPADHPLAGYPFVSPQDLHNVPLVTMTGRATLRQDLEAIFSSYNIKMKICMEIDNVGVMQTMVAAGLGVSILPASTRIHNEHLAAVPFLVNDPHLQEKTFRHFSLIHLENMLSPEAQSWINVCHTVAANMSSSHETESEAYYWDSLDP